MRGDLVGTVAVDVVALHLLVLGGRWLLGRPQRGVLLLAALAPFNGLLLLIPHPGLVDGWKEGLVLLTLGASLLAPTTTPRERAPFPPWGAALLGLGALGVTSALVVGGAQGLLGVKIGFFYLLLLPVLWRCPLSSAERDRLVTALMVTGVVVGAVGLVQQAVGPDVLHGLGYAYNDTIRTAGGYLRSFSTFNQPFPFGLYEMAVLLVGVPVALTDLHRRRNAVFLALVPLLLAGMLSSIVRAAVAGLVVGGVFLGWRRYRVLSHVVPVVLAIALLVPTALFTPLLSPSSLGQRTSGWSETFGQVLAAPLGNGIGASGSAAEKAAIVSGHADTSYQPDNYYFKTAFELGPIGLWLLLLVLVSTFLWARSLGSLPGPSVVPAPGHPRSDAPDRALADGVAAAVLAAMVASTVSTYFEIFPMDLFFWLLLGVLSSLTTGSPSTPSPSDRVAAVSRPTSASSSGR